MSFNEELKKILVTALVLAMLLAGCSPMAISPDGVATRIGTVDNDLPVSSPTSARDTTIDYLRVKYPSTVPAATVNWQGENISSQDAVATKNFLYSFRNWTVSVVSPQVLPEKKVYTVIVENKAEGFQWAGLIDAYGRILRMGRLNATSTPLPPTST